MSLRDVGLVAYSLVTLWGVIFVIALVFGGLRYFLGAWRKGRLVIENPTDEDKARVRRARLRLCLVFVGTIALFASSHILSTWLFD